MKREKIVKPSDIYNIQYSYGSIAISVQTSVSARNGAIAVNWPICTTVGKFYEYICGVLGISAVQLNNEIESIGILCYMGKITIIAHEKPRVKDHSGYFFSIKPPNGITLHEWSEPDPEFFRVADAVGVFAMDCIKDILTYGVV